MVTFQGASPENAVFEKSNPKKDLLYRAKLPFYFPFYLKDTGSLDNGRYP